MLERIRIQNFQAHDKLAINLDPGITTIVGPSDVGKSAVIRALRWVLTNQPQGTAFIRHGSKGCTVAVDLDGRNIIRRRGGSLNSYELDGQELKAFGTGVPDLVARLVNMGPNNWQGQHDAPFWFSESAPQVSRELNAVVDLGVIDDSLKAIAKTVTNAKARADAATELLSAAVDDRKATAWAKAADSQLQAVEALAAAADDAETARDHLRGLLDTAKTTHETAETATRRAEAAQQVVDAGQVAKDALDAAQVLRAALSGLDYAARAVATAEDEAKAAHDAVEAYRPEGKCPVCGSYPGPSTGE